MNTKKKTICVIDGQGGGIGSHIIKQLRSHFQEAIDIIALGTNAIAAAQMLKSRANRGAPRVSGCRALGRFWYNRRADRRGPSATVAKGEP